MKIKRIIPKNAEPPEFIKSYINMYIKDPKFIYCFWNEEFIFNGFVFLEEFIAIDQKGKIIYNNKCFAGWYNQLIIGENDFFNDNKFWFTKEAKYLVE